MLRSKDQIEFRDRVYPITTRRTRQPVVIAGLLETEADSVQPPDWPERWSSAEPLSEFNEQIISSAREGIIILDRNLMIRLWNPFMEALSGLSSAQVLGRHYSELFPFVNELGVDALLDRALAGESLFSPDILYHIPASGKSGRASASYDPLRNHNRGIVGVMIFVQEITSRKLNEEALRESQRRLQLAVQGSNVGLWDWDTRTTTVYYSPEWKGQLGYEDDEIGDSFDEWERRLHPDDHDAACAMVQAYLEQPWPDYENVFRLRHKDGSYRWILARASMHFGADGRLDRMFGCHVDITTHTHTEARLERLATAVEQAAESIVITDVAGTIQYVNPGFERTTGYSRDEVIGKNSRILKSERQDAAFYHEMWNTISRGEVWTGRFINKRKDGTLFEEDATISPVRDGSERIVNFVAAKRDVTKEVELEKQLLHAQKMEAVGRLAGGIAHDFNNLLTAIIGYSQLMEARLGDDHTLRSEVAQILDAGQRAAALTSQLLAFSRRQTIVPRLISLNDTIGRLMKMLRRIIGEDIDLSFHPSSSADQVFADAGQIDQVIMNLAINAKDAMPSGGRLIIETRNVTLGEAFCREHPWARPGNYVRISVSDAGVGMDAETQRRVFEPYFTTKEVGKGTGLGLAVVYGIVQRHDGLIHIYSEPGHGTSFKIYLKAAGEASNNTLQEQTVQVRGGTETILVAEDEETLRVLARRILESLGYRVLVASDGEEAVRACESGSEEIDLLILDLVMPRMGGRKALDRIRELGKPVPVIYVTGYSPEALQSQVHESGALLIQKPYAVDELARKVREVLDSRSAT